MYARHSKWLHIDVQGAFSKSKLVKVGDLANSIRKSTRLKLQKDAAHISTITTASREESRIGSIKALFPFMYTPHNSLHLLQNVIMKQHTSANHSSIIAVSTGSGYSGVTTIQQAVFIATAMQIVQMYWSIAPCERSCDCCTCEEASHRIIYQHPM